MIQEVDGGVVLDLRVQPGAARNAVVGTHGDAIKVKVQAPPLEGRANDAVLALIARELGRRPGDVELVAGVSSRTKRVRVTGVTLAEVEAWLTSTASHQTRRD